MKKQVCASVMGLVLASASTGAAAEEWDFLAGLSDDYQAKPSLALVGGIMDPDSGSLDSGAVYGVEFSLNCPLLQPPSNRIRQQLSLTQFDEDGVEITSLELSPHYVVPMSENLEIGFGPGFGVLDVEAGPEDEMLFGVHAGASVHYRQGAFFAGAEARYLVTTEERFGGTDRDADNARVLLKVGINL
ncbi:hypothetical protein [Marinobacter sp.]|uniref:hypothetical protein n=1 Tax=Marinobacter sp. TaxID=50741 RepID=UPI002B484F68|nr:hypothetical protein [Marinobacter sp.]HKK57383.1 hypothetical protein [Marinobacter sp.]